MENKNENMTNKLTDQQLEDVAGGAPRVYTQNTSEYTSGDTPKYAVNA